MTPRFFDACLAEIDEAIAWYGDQSGELPGRLLDDLQETVGRLLLFPEAFRVVENRYRKVNLSKFPYALFFRIDPGEIVLVAFFHLHSDPAKWTGVLKSR